MKSTFSIITEKVCELLNVKPFLLQSVSRDAVYGIWIDPSAAQRDSYICSFIFSELNQEENFDLRSLSFDSAGYNWQK